MPYDGNGNYVRAHNWAADATNGIDINATEMDAEDNGFAAALSNAVTRDGQGKMSVDFLPNSDNTLNLGSGTFRWASFNGTPISLIIPTQQSIGGLLWPLSAAEIATAVTPLNFALPPGHVDRYAINTTPGTTDMGPALNIAINVALATIGSGLSGTPIRFMAGAYSIATKPVFGSVTTNIVPLDIGGQGVGTQLINNMTAGTSPLFDMTGKNGWWLHDFLMCGNSAHKNAGIAVDFTGSSEAIEWRISNVISLVAGVGFVLANTNTGVVENCKHWPGNNPALIVPQTVTVTDISHGLYLTGVFVHNVLITNFQCLPNSNYNATNRGIKCDSSFSFGVTIIMPLVQTGSGNNNEVGIDFNPSSSGAGLTIQGAYCEGATISLGSVSQSVISGAVGGGVGGAIVINPGSRENKIVGCNVGIIDIDDSSCFGNFLSGCFAGGPVAWSATVPYIAGNYASNGGVNYKCILANTNNAPPNATFWSVFSANAFNDSSEGANLSGQPTRIIGCSFEGFANGVADLGSNWRNLLTYASSMTADTWSGNTRVIRVSNGSAFTIAMAHPRNGQDVRIVLRNETSGAMGAVTWNGINTPASVPLPAAGFNRAYTVQYDSDFASWHMVMWSPADVAN